LAARPAMAVPPAKGLDEVCAWLHKAALTPVTKLSRTTVTERTRLGLELNCVMKTSFTKMHDAYVLVGDRGD